LQEDSGIRITSVCTIPDSVDGNAVVVEDDASANAGIGDDPSYKQNIYSNGDTDFDSPGPSSSSGSADTSTSNKSSTDFSYDPNNVRVIRYPTTQYTNKFLAS